LRKMRGDAEGSWATFRLLVGLIIPVLGVDQFRQLDCSLQFIPGSLILVVSDDHFLQAPAALPFTHNETYFVVNVNGQAGVVPVGHGPEYTLDISSFADTLIPGPNDLYVEAGQPVWGFCHLDSDWQAEHIEIVVALKSALYAGAQRQPPETQGIPQKKEVPLVRWQDMISPESQAFRGQQHEDKYLLETFFQEGCPSSGVIVEVGALDGLRYSNSYVFETVLGWDAVLVEPNPTCAQELRKNRPNSHFAPVAVCADGPKEVPIISKWDHRVSGLCSPITGQPSFMTQAYLDESASIELEQQWKPPFYHEVPCSSLGSILRNFSIERVDIMSIDVEGAELDALASMDWTIPVHILFVEVPAGDPARAGTVRSLMLHHGFESHSIALNSEFFVSKKWPLASQTVIRPPVD